MSCECCCCQDKEERKELVIKEIVIALDSRKVQKKLDEVLAGDFDSRNEQLPNTF